MRICTAKSLQSGKRAVGDPKTYWKNGQTIQISIIGGTLQQKEFVKFWANKWTEVVNLNFEWIDFTSGQIRITFKNEGSWSYVGTECLNVVGETMNFGWIDEDIRNNDGSTILHEFGHAIGLHHEHQNPDGGIKWNRTKVIKDLSGAPNYWSVDMIERNVLSKLGGETQYTKFDPDSIMLYSFPKDWTLDGFQAKRNTTISKVDVEFLSKIYPKAVTPVNKLIDIKKVFLKESELNYLSLPVIQRTANGLGISFTGKTKETTYPNDIQVPLKMLTVNRNNMNFIWISAWLKQAFTLFCVCSSIVLAFFMPVGGLLVAAITAILLDFLIGTVVSIKKEVPIESKRAWRTPQKLLVAIGLILGFHLIHEEMIAPLPTLPLIGTYIENLSLAYLVTFSILWSELVSVGEKVKLLYGWNILELIKIRFSFLLRKKEKEDENNKGG